MAKNGNEIWSVKGLEQRIEELILANKLNEVGIDGLYGLVAEEFSEAFEEAQVRFTKTAFKRKVEELVWNESRLDSLRQVVRHNVGLDKFSEFNPFVPAAMVQKKVKEFSGAGVREKVPVKFEVGIGRVASSEVLDALEEVNLSRYTQDNPYVLQVKDPATFKATILNGPHIGLPYNRVIEENALRCALADAERHGSDVVFITGGLMHIDTKKAGGYIRAHRARTSGHNLDPEVMDPSYREKAKQIREDGKYGEMVYVTLAEKTASLLTGYQKIFVKPDGNPEFSGKVRIIFGPDEEELIENLAYAEATYYNRLAQEKVGVEKALIMNALKSLGVKKPLKPEERAIEFAEAVSAMEEVSQALKSAKSKDEKEDLTFELEVLEAQIDRLETLMELEQKLEEAVAEVQRTRVTNIDDEEHQRYVAKVLAFMVQRFEEVIPNCKVIGYGTTFVQLGDDGEIIEFNQDWKAQANPHALDQFLRKHGHRRTLDGPLPSAIVVSNPHNPRYGWAVVEYAENAERESSDVFMPAVVLDKDFLKDRMDIQRKTNNIEKLIGHEDFEPGVLHLTYSNRLWHAEPVSIDAVKGYQQRYTRPSGKSAARPKTPYIYMLIRTDCHFGHPWTEYYQDTENGRKLNLAPAFIEILRRHGLVKGTKLPIHSFHSLDDGVQGHHFPTEKQPHQNVRPYYEIEEELNELAARADKLKNDNPEKAMALMRKMSEISTKQLRLRGETWTQNQLSEYVQKMLNDNLDFFTAVLNRSVKSGVEYKGVSHYLGESYDSRDIAPITEGDGNHFFKTVWNELTEGFIYVAYLRGALQNAPGTRAFRDDLDKLVRAPLYGNLHVAWGTVGVPGGYEWGLSLRAQPAKKAGPGDPIKNIIVNTRERGNYTRIFDGRHSVHVSGDIHRFGRGRIPNVDYISVASGTDTDPYGERGYSPNNTGIAIIGLPVEGPASGPTRLITFRHEFVRDYFREPFEIDFDELLYNPA